MIQEYLLLNVDEKEKVEAYSHNGISAIVHPIKDEKLFCFRFEINGENEKSAQLLSKIDAYCCEHFQIITLKNESAAYFNKRLYPIISEFERKLRELLYLASAIDDGSNTQKIFSDLESKDFGKIFEMLFIDDNFISSTKNGIKGRQRGAFTKSGVLAWLETIDENIFWDSLLGENAVPTLRKEFNAIRDYRNDVMHSHNISFQRYQEINRLYSDVNSEIDVVLRGVTETDAIVSSPDFNETLESALSFQEQHERIQEFALSNLVIPEQLQTILEAYGNMQNPGLTALLEQFRDYSTVYTQSSELIRLQEQLKDYAKRAELSAEYLVMKEKLNSIKLDIPPTLKELKEFSNMQHSQISPDISKLQKHLLSLQALVNKDTNDPPDENKEKPEGKNNG